MQSYATILQRENTLKKTYKFLKDSIARANTLGALERISLTMGQRKPGETYAQCSVRLTDEGKLLQGQMYEFIVARAIYIESYAPIEGEA